MIFITTQRLIIRAFKNKDASALFDYLSSPRTPCFQDEKLNSLDDAIKEIDRRILDNSQFAVCLKETDELIGHLFADNSEEPDRNTWSVGWHFNKSYEGKGYATESVTALFQYLFSEKEARRLYAYVEDYNLASQKLCARLHMRYEGCFKEFVSFIQDDGVEKYDDTFIFALLKKDWEQLLSNY
ncbi:N-acetyltransferase GCN5 [Morganella morganii]|uniref:GNAT family N-acetyltransferase n=1 Tax=Morganella morganii TaxID=582 RepID=UPI001BD94422|nr:GNAT family protein [Morganella morganii]MBT0372105.1 GNAT family N-acetyltransferase [Morganella morganii subsp. morganii]GIZ29427.1 N-acetyltransferase GCN5 [Morganella morganii]GIZ32964.1 N-acetyltransferase GCN5 [Morganella morganii]GIZ36194.1 N-acetyltransferase GCN5 [Morganella morganii]HDU8708463.1 GNAT family N-acetyltransferase [Morganella morganii subsp. morganii]